MRPALPAAPATPAPGSPTIAMPAATVPVGKAAGANAPTKPAGFTRPAGLSRQTASRVADEEEEEVAFQPVPFSISVVAALISLFFCWQVYSADQTPNRTSEFLFGDPSAAASSTSSDDSAASDEEAEEEDSSSSDESDSSDEETDDSEEEE